MTPLKHVFLNFFRNFSDFFKIFKSFSAIFKIIRKFLELAAITPYRFNH
nr:MAG TPA: hypothetical protein [Caudoviricetes sp.]DAS11444.1 MAG TPA: hypothetical protein [Caudoviricetes sp.]